MPVSAVAAPLIIAAFAASLLLTAAAAGAADLPDQSSTPGAVASTDIAEICESDGEPGSAYSRAHRSMNEVARRADFARYGIPWSERGRYEDDHLVPLCLGGADTTANRWPQPRWGEWNAYQKDDLEGYACRTVCAGRLGALARRNTGFWLRPIGDPLTAASSVSGNDDGLSAPNLSWLGRCHSTSLAAVAGP